MEQKVKITFFIDATILKNEKGFVTTCCLLDEAASCETFDKDKIGEYYEQGRLLLSSVPFDAIVTFDESVITFGEAITTSIEQILIESSISNMKKKLLKLNDGVDIDNLEYEIVYFETVSRYVEVLEESIRGNKNINIDIKMVDCGVADLKECPSSQISKIQNEKYLSKELLEESKKKEEKGKEGE